MKRFQWTKNPYICGGLTLFTVIVLSMVFYRIISDFSAVGRFFAKATDVLLPFIVGLALAYLLAPVYNLVHKHTVRWFTGKKSKPSQQKLERLAEENTVGWVMAGVCAPGCAIAIPPETTVFPADHP